MKKKFYLTCVVVITMALMYVLTTIPDKNNQIFNQTVDLKDPGLYKEVPQYDKVFSFELKHIGGATTSINLVTFSTSTNIGGFYRNSEDSLNIRVDNYEQIKRFGESPKMVPIVPMSVLVHELVHQTTMYNHDKCLDIMDRVCQEQMAYDVQSLYQQVVGLNDDGLIKLTKD